MACNKINKGNGRIDFELSEDLIMSEKNALFEILEQESVKNTIKKGSFGYTQTIATLQSMLKDNKSVVTFINHKPVRISLNTDGTIKEESLSAN